MDMISSIWYSRLTLPNGQTKQLESVSIKSALISLGQELISAKSPRQSSVDSGLQITFELSSRPFDKKSENLSLIQEELRHLPTVDFSTDSIAEYRSSLESSGYDPITINILVEDRFGSDAVSSESSSAYSLWLNDPDAKEYRLASTNVKAFEAMSLTHYLDLKRSLTRRFPQFITQVQSRVATD